MACKLQEVDGYLKELHWQNLSLGGEPWFSIYLPFSCKIMNEPVPRHFKAPAMKAYDSTTDLFDNLESFKSLILLQGIYDALMYKSFPTTFKEVTRGWYTQLLSGSIHSFKEFDQ